MPSLTSEFRVVRSDERNAVPLPRRPRQSRLAPVLRGWVGLLAALLSVACTRSGGGKGTDASLSSAEQAAELNVRTLDERVEQDRLAKEKG